MTNRLTIAPTITIYDAATIGVTVMQNVSQILVFDHKPSIDNPASLVDMLSLDMNVSEAAQHYRRYWQGGHYRGAHDGLFVAIRAGYAIDNNEVFFPGYSPL